MRILLAEDERELSDALVMILKHNNYSVDAVYNGQDALDYIMADDYDGVILDIMMPKMDGITVLKSVRRQGNNVPVLILTAKSELDDCVVGLDAGADDYLSKPFAAKELLARLRAVTRRKTATATTVLKMGNMELNCAGFELRSPKGRMHLPNKEFQMLEMMMANLGQLISTERFLEKVWGYETETDTRTVWVYISYLRKKLQELDEARNSEKGGSGIGLSVAKAVVSAHKGKISAFSEGGHSMLIKVVW
ncbi:response regulator transcription factor [uncultured Eubacterium sp.]|uniref:response regulator transcription factor n=1 Tax=uncultured Eubacterium sp. TaxID=165185 RepID=UPI00259979B6|nr:response regulator [uncultured Eubacterium sp.]